MSKLENEFKVGEKILPDTVASKLSVELFQNSSGKHHADLAKFNNELHRGGLLPGLNVVGQDSSGHLLIADNKKGADHKLYQVDSHGKLTSVYDVEMHGKQSAFKKHKEESKVDAKQENKTDPYRFHQGEAKVPENSSLSTQKHYDASKEHTVKPPYEIPQKSPAKNVIEQRRNERLYAAEDSFFNRKLPVNLSEIYFD